ncbi:MAG: hypothetical protein QXH62_05010 [Candidatus Bathyarchaeia archaeon]
MSEVPSPLSDIVEIMNRIIRWVDFPEKETMPVPYACESCERLGSFRTLPESPLYFAEVSRFIDVSEKERANLRRQIEEYFAYTKAVLRALSGMQKQDPMSLFRIRRACKHVELSLPSHEISRDIRRSLRPLINMLIKTLIDEEKAIKQILKSEYLKHEFKGDYDAGYCLICESCLKQMFPQFQKNEVQRPEIPCFTTEEFSSLYGEECKMQQLKSWLLSQGFEVPKIKVPTSLRFTLRDFLIARKDGKNYGLGFSRYHGDMLWLAEQGIKLDYLVAPNVITNIFNFPLSEQAVVFDIESNETIKLGEIQVESSIEVAMEQILSQTQNILNYDHDKIKDYFKNLGKEMKYLSFEETPVGKGDRTDVAWFDRHKTCIVSMEIENSLGPSIAKDIYKFKRIKPKLAVLIIKRGGNVEAIRDFAKELDDAFFLTIFLSHKKWILIRNKEVIKMGNLQF